MSEYKHTISKKQPGGFSESPQQDIGNSSSPLLDGEVSVKGAVTTGIAVIYGRKVIGSTYQAVSGQLGSARLEETMSAFTKLSTFGFLAVATGGVTIPALALGGEIISGGINNLVEEHARNLENARLRATRGVRVSYNAGGYYG